MNMSRKKSPFFLCVYEVPNPHTPSSRLVNVFLLFNLTKLFESVRGGELYLIPPNNVAHIL